MSQNKRVDAIEIDEDVGDDICIAIPSPPKRRTYSPPKRRASFWVSDTKEISDLVEEQGAALSLLRKQLMDEVYAFLDDKILTPEQLSPYTSAQNYFEHTRPVGKYASPEMVGMRVNSSIESVEACLDDMFPHDVNLYHWRLVRINNNYIDMILRAGPKPGFRTSVWWEKKMLGQT